MHFLDEINKSTGEDAKPEIITFYNMTKGAVKCSVYSCSRRTKRWPMALFFALLNIAGINSHILYCWTKKEFQLPRKQFLKNLSLILVKGLIQERSSLTNLSSKLKTTVSKYSETNRSGINVEENSTKSKDRCYMCGRAKNNYTTIRCYKCRKFCCKAHNAAICTNCKVNE